MVALLVLLCAVQWWRGLWSGGWTVAAALLLLLGLRDLAQSRHSVLRNYPVIGHLRFFLEFIRPEIRQYFVESDTESVPFSRQQRALVYQRAKEEIDNRPFGTQLDTYGAGFEWINHSLTPVRIESHDFRCQIGAVPQSAPQANSCSQPYAASVFNISAM
ncbi:MAG: FMN-binding glutamate synthase family protein, partial [Burkholderiaceae bacterium]